MYEPNRVTLSLVAYGSSVELSFSEEITAEEFLNKLEVLVIAMGYATSSWEDAVLARAAEITQLDELKQRELSA